MDQRDASIACYDDFLMSVNAANAGAGAGRVVVDPGPFNGVKVFSATMFADRERLGEKVTSWIAENSHVQLTELTVTQSSDASFHCIAITVFYRESLRR